MNAGKNRCTIVGPCGRRAISGRRICRKIHEAAAPWRSTGRRDVMEVAQHIGDDTVRCIMLCAERRPRARHEGRAPPARRHPACPWASRRWAACSTCWANPSTAASPVPRTRERWDIHRQAPAFEEQSPAVEILETGIKVIDLLDALCQGRQDRPVRRRRRGQDRADPGADPQRGHGARRLFRVHRRGRAQPRGQRPVARNDATAASSDKTALVFGQMNEPPGRAYARGAVGPDHGRVLPRRGAPGRAAVHRQHLPLCPGGQRGFHAAGPHALRRGLPAHPGQRDGRAAGAHHLHRQTAPSPPCRRSTCPRTT